MPYTGLLSWHIVERAGQFHSKCGDNSLHRIRQQCCETPKTHQSIAAFFLLSPWFRHSGGSQTPSGRTLSSMERSTWPEYSCQQLGPTYLSCKQGTLDVDPPAQWGPQETVALSYTWTATSWNVLSLNQPVKLLSNSWPTETVWDSRC